MKFIFSIILIFIVFASKAQSPANTQVKGFSKPDRDISSAAIPSAQAAIKATNWKQQTLLRPNDAGAWLNYYNWQRRDKTINAVQRAKELDNTITQSGKYIKGSWQYSLMLFINSGKKDSAALFQSLNLTDDKTLVYPYMIQFAIINNNEKMLSAYCELLNKETPVSHYMYLYHYNTLMSAKKGAIIYAKGLSDLVPLATLQKVYGIRNDIHLKYYEGNIGSETNTYLCLSLGKEVLEQYPGAAYTGLLVKVNNPDENELSTHIRNDFSMTDFTGDEPLSEEEKIVYRNYLPSFLLLYKTYKLNNDPALAKWKKQLTGLAKLTGTTDMVNKITGE